MGWSPRRLLRLGKVRRRRRRSRSSGWFGSIWRTVGPTTTGIGIIGLIGTAVFGGIDLSRLDIGRPSESNDASRSTTVKIGMDASRLPGVPPSELFASAPGGNPTIRVATFNLGNFGEKKSSDPEVMDRIAMVVSRFDVVALQEIHGENAEPVRRLVDRLRRGGAPFAATVSDRIGKNEHYRESYAFLWNDATVQMIPGTDFLVADPGRRMAREPMACSFRCRLPPDVPQQPFTFTLINVHTSPSEVAPKADPNEMDALDDVYLSVANYGWQQFQEDDVILLGDLNVDRDHFRQLDRIESLHSVGGNAPTNTRRSACYDHIVIDQTATGEFSGRWGIYDLTEALQIDIEDALSISDHQPVWAEFQMIEALPSMAAGRTQIIR